MNGRQARRHRAERTAQRRRVALPHDGDVGVVCAWCASIDDLKDARQQTHDGLIELMGVHRTGGVAWRQFEASHAADALAVLSEGSTGEMLAYYRRLGNLLDESGGFLIVALAAGVPPLTIEQRSAFRNDAVIPDGWEWCPDCNGEGRVSIMHATPDCDESVSNCTRCTTERGIVPIGTMFHG